MNLIPHFEEFIKGRRCVLARHAKKHDHSKLLSLALHAIATPLTNPKELPTQTLICRLVGQALIPEATEKAQIKIGGGFYNFLDINEFVVLHQESSSVYRVDLGEDEEFNQSIANRAHSRRVANITTHPGDWVKPFNRGVPIVKRLRPEDQDDYTIDKMPKVYRALNALGSTRWTVNSKMLQLMEDGFFGFSPEVFDIDTTEAINTVVTTKRQSLRRADWYKDNTNFNSREIRVRSKSMFKDGTKDARKTLGDAALADAFAITFELAYDVQGEDLYFQHNCDPRGRLFALSNYLTPQTLSLIHI